MKKPEKKLLVGKDLEDRRRRLGIDAKGEPDKDYTNGYRLRAADYELQR